MKIKLLNSDKQKTYALILSSGDKIMSSLLAFSIQHTLHASQFTAIGAISRATLGFFDFSTKNYDKIEIDEQAEVLSLAGDITMYQKEQTLHAHIVIGKKDGSAHGGHLIEATVHPTLEMIITESPEYLEREMDKDSGLPLIKI